MTNGWACPEIKNLDAIHHTRGPTRFKIYQHTQHTQHYRQGLLYLSRRTKFIKVHIIYKSYGLLLTAFNEVRDHIVYILEKYHCLLLLNFFTILRIVAIWCSRKMPSGFWKKKNLLLIHIKYKYLYTIWTDFFYSCLILTAQTQESSFNIKFLTNTTKSIIIFFAKTIKFQP